MKFTTISSVLLVGGMLGLVHGVAVERTAIGNMGKEASTLNALEVSDNLHSDFKSAWNETLVRPRVDVSFVERRDTFRNLIGIAINGVKIIRISFAGAIMEVIFQNIARSDRDVYIEDTFTGQNGGVVLEPGKRNVFRALHALIEDPALMRVTIPQELKRKRGAITNEQALSTGSSQGRCGGTLVAQLVVHSYPQRNGVGCFQFGLDYVSPGTAALAYTNSCTSVKRVGITNLGEGPSCTIVEMYPRAPQTVQNFRAKIGDTINFTVL